jgi:predicted ATPase
VAHADVSGSVLLDRSQELGRLLRSLESAAAAEGSAVLVEGPGGIGKTELVLAAQ